MTTGEFDTAEAARKREQAEADAAFIAAARAKIAEGKNPFEHLRKPKAEPVNPFEHLRRPSAQNAEKS